jgi:hypothetical protein
MTVDGGQPILGNDITSFSPHTPNISYGAVTNLQLGKHQVVIAPGARTSSVFSYIFVRHLLYFLCSYLTSDQIDYVVLENRTDSSTSSSASSTSGTPTSSASVQTSGSQTSAADSQPAGYVHSCIILCLLFNRSLSHRHSKKNTAVIAGATVGGVVGLVIIIALAFLLLREKRRNNSPREIDPDPRDPSFISEPLSGHHIRSLSNPTSPLEPPPYMQQLSAMRPASLAANSHGMPSQSDLSSSAPDSLTTFASMHRDLIPPDLESKLRVIGYQPHLDPDTISAEDWQQGGVGAFSLQLLRDIYAR